MPSKYALLSLPLGAFDLSSPSDALALLRSLVPPDAGSVLPFAIPSFKIGTLDSLVQQADELTKLELACQGLVAKVADSLRVILDGDEAKISQQKLVNDKPTDQYIASFSWNKIRYRADKSLKELVNALQKELANIDNDVKSKMAQYNTSKTQLATLQRRQTGNLSTKSLTLIVNPSLLIQNSEYLETHLIAVPSASKRDFLRSYETLVDMVVPRSSTQVAEDDEFALFAVVTFKKTSREFLQKCREHKWTPRQYKHVEGGREEEQRQLDCAAHEEKKVWGEALRMARTGWSESVMIWLHAMALRVFVEAVLRYGLPLDYVSIIVQTKLGDTSKLRAALDAKFSYLGGNAVGRDKHGKMVKDDAALALDMAATGLWGTDGQDYTPYVYYEMELP